MDKKVASLRVAANQLRKLFPRVGVHAHRWFPLVNALVGEYTHPTKNVYLLRRGSYTTIVLFIDSGPCIVSIQTDFCGSFCRPAHYLRQLRRAGHRSGRPWSLDGDARDSVSPSHDGKLSGRAKFFDSPSSPAVNYSGVPAWTPPSASTGCRLQAVAT